MNQEQVTCVLCNGSGKSDKPRNKDLVYIFIHHEDPERMIACRSIDELYAAINEYEYTEPYHRAIIEVKHMTDEEYYELTELESV